MKDYSVNIIGLSQKTHHFSFRLEDAFFKAQEIQLFEKGNFDAEVVLDKHETFINAEFKISGTAALICDRSLEPFDLVLNLKEKIVFKYGEEEGELSEEIVVIKHDKVSIDIGQYLFEFIALAMPMKRLHPRFEETDEDEDDSEGKLVYTSKSSVDQDPEQPMDPRWEQLKKVTIKK